MEIKAELNHLRISPRKVRMVANVIKGMETDRALFELQNLVRRASMPLTKLLQSALANARHNFHIDEQMVVRDIRVDGGPVQKRMRPRAFGRAATIRKRTSHVRLVLDIKDSSGTIRKKRASSVPLLRDVARPEDAKYEASAKEQFDIHAPSNSSRNKNTRNFVRRIFRRKVV